MSDWLRHFVRQFAVRVGGCSHLRWRDKIYCHRDYVDAGALHCEYLPVLGRAIAWLKRRLG